MQQPGPHGGAGTTTAYPFFRDAPALGFEFRKRVLHKGAGIGLHQHDKDEVYYVVSGKGRYIVDGVEPAEALMIIGRQASNASKSRGSRPNNSRVKIRSNITRLPREAGTPLLPCRTSSLLISRSSP